MKRRFRGFSTIELVIAVGIVGLLVAIAVPAWGAMVARSRQLEARNGLQAIRALEQVFFREQGRYGSFVEIGFVPLGDGKYGFLISTESDGGYAGPYSGGIDYGGGDGHGFGRDDAGALGPEGEGEAEGEGEGEGRSPDGRRRMRDGGGGDRPSEGRAMPGDPRDDLGDGGGAPYGNPHFDEDSFECVAFGRISNAPPPHDVDVWSVDHYGWVENISPGY